MIKRFLMISACCAGVAFGQTPRPHAPLSVVDEAQAKAWMIETFQVPPDAKNTKFFVSESGNRAGLMWETFNDGGKPGHWGHTRAYDFSTGTVITSVDVDFMNPPR
jgi:hypothetical protein